MAKLWGILRKKHRIWKDKVVEVAGDDLSAAQEAVREFLAHRDEWLVVTQDDAASC